MSTFTRSPGTANTEIACDLRRLRVQTVMRAAVCRAPCRGKLVETGRPTPRDRSTTVNLRAPLTVIAAVVVFAALPACSDDGVSGVNDTVDINTEVSVLTNDPNVVNTTVPFDGPDISSETQSPATTSP
jgi:hypothetical protein